MTANPQVVACGEIANGFEGRTGRELKCSCGKLAKDCPVWSAFARGSNASLNHDALVLTLLEHVQGKYAILIDSSKTAWGSIAARFRLRRLLGQRFFMLHLVRDPRAVCWSAIHWSEAVKEKKEPPGIFYYWKGERPRDPNAPQLDGTAEIRLESADRAAGYFTTRADTRPNMRTSGVYWRADPKDMSILDGPDDRQRVALIAERLRQWKSIANA
jgi:hypothetical protein